MQSAVQLAVEFPQPTVKFQIDELSKLRKTLDFFPKLKENLSCLQRTT